MKSVLISIQPKWCELIASGKKTVEVRKTKPKLEMPFKVYIYCTKQGKQFFHGGIGEKECLFKKPDTGKIKFDYSFELMCCKNKYTKDNFLSGKVIGEFVCDKIYDITPHFDTPTFPNQYICDWGYGKEFDCLSFEELTSYLNGKQGYGWHISNLVIYDKPRELSGFYRYCGDDPKCDGCEAHYFSNTECGKEDYCCSIIDGCKPLKRPPQSWCYVESERSENGTN